MAIETLNINQGTETPIAFDSIGGTAYIQEIKINKGADGVDSLWDGNVGVSSGTITSLPNTPGGTLGLVSTVTTVSNLTNGSIVITNGTIASLPNVTLAGGTIQNLNAGTITRVSTIGTLEVGTISALPNIPGGTLGLVSTVTTVSNVTNGSIVVTNGTIASLPNVTLAGGTVQNLNGGTITSVGTVVGLGGTVAVNIVAGGAGDGALLDGVSSSIKATVLDYTNSNPLAVRLTDTNGDYVTPFTIGTTIGTINTGTLALITRVSTIGTLEVGTISAMPNVPGGTLGLVSTVSNLTNGSIVVTNGTIAVLPNLPQGSINVTAGTVGGKAASGAAISGNPIPVGGTDGGGTIYAALVDTAGRFHTVTEVGTISSLPNVTLAGGTIQNLNAGTITRVSTIGTLEVGTISALPNVTLAGGTIQNLNAGTITRVSTIGTLEVGTISALPNLPQGSINVTAGTITAGSIIVTAGTITAGTINSGTFRADARTTQSILTYGTQFAATGAGYATLVGSTVVGVGTSLWLQDLNIINPYGTVLSVVGNGTALSGSSVFFRGVLGTQTVGGIEKSYAKAVNAGMTNQDLVVYLGAAGTVDINISYFISA